MLLHGPELGVAGGSVKRVGCGVLQGVQAAFRAVHGIWGFDVVGQFGGWKSVESSCKAYNKILTLLTERPSPRNPAPNPKS